jgi:hypothetical protein
MEHLSSSLVKSLEGRKALLELAKTLEKLATSCGMKRRWDEAALG